MPPFALFEFVAFQLASAFGANNAKSGTCVAEAARRSQLASGTCVVEAAKRSRLAGSLVRRSEKRGGFPPL